MESVLSILCIVFFAVLTYGLIQGRNLTKNHLDDCRVIYVPEEINLELAYKSIANKDLNSLKRRARELGATREFVDKFKDSVNNNLYIELKKFIIVNSISNEHILFDTVENDIKTREKDNIQRRIENELSNRKYLIEQAKQLGIKYKDVSDNILKDKVKTELLKKTSGMKTPITKIQELRKDVGLDD
jgi:hypothetical protein